MKKKNKVPATNIEIGLELKRCAACKDAVKANNTAVKKNYICIEGNHIPMSDALVAAYKRMLGICVKLSDVTEGDTFKIGDYEFVVLEQYGDTAAVILKDLLPDTTAFGESNNRYDGSYADQVCCDFEEKLAAIIGSDNLLVHSVDLTADDGLKDYGRIDRKVSLLTAAEYRSYVDVLDRHKPKRWWWLATPHSTAAHENDLWVKCVAPSGGVINGRCNYGNGGVRPFCILKSNIFVSK